MDRRGFLGSFGGLMAGAATMGMPGNTNADAIDGGGISYYWIPHMDDEAFAMAIRMRRDVEAGRKVVATVFHTAYTTLRVENFRIYRNTRINIGALRQSRRREFMDCAAVIGAHEVAISPVKKLTHANIVAHIRALAERTPGARHYTCMDDEIINKNPMHAMLNGAVREAVDGLASELAFGWVYAARDLPNPPCDEVLSLTSEELKRRRMMMDVYSYWNPSISRFATGLMQVEQLVLATKASTKEYWSYSK